MQSWLVLGCLFSASTAAAQGPALFRWQPGQVLNYKVEQLTKEIEVVGGVRAETSMKLNVGKRWQVMTVDAAGVATLQQSLTAMRIEKTSPAGDKLIFDSADPAGSDPQLKTQLSKYVGTPLALLRVDARGKVLEVKDCKFTTPSRYEHELPFAITLPPEPLKPGLVWQRTYDVTLEPPLGANDKFPAVQQCSCKSIADDKAVVQIATTFKALPPAPADQVPLLQFQPEGEAVFNLQAGRLEKATLKIDKELTNHQADDSSYQFKSSYVEEFVPAQ